MRDGIQQTGQPRGRVWAQAVCGGQSNGHDVGLGSKKVFFHGVDTLYFGELDSWKSCLMCALPALRGLTLHHRLKEHCNLIARKCWYQPDRRDSILPDRE